MDDSKENIVLKSLSKEESYEQIEEKEEIACTASKCINTRWSKPVNVRKLMFVSKDVLVIHAGKTLIFHNVRTQKEDILVVGMNNSTPADGGSLDMDGIGCIDSCGIDLLALAEQPPIAKVIICRYPDLKVLTTLTDNSNSAAYKSISFLRLEYLIGLRDYPAFDLIIWAWRIQEQMLVINTGFIQPNQCLNVSTTGREVYISQTERDVKCRLQLWTVFIGCKTAYAERTRVGLSDDVDVVSGCWTPGGWFVFCDASANVYRTHPTCAPTAELCVPYVGNDGETCAMVCPGKQGFMLYTVDGLTCFKDVKGVFTKHWTMVINHTLQCMIAGENEVYGWSDEGSLLELTQKKTQILKVYGANIKYFKFVGPADETVATINENNVLQVWHISTGELKSEMKLNGFATSLSSNPLYYYVAISFKNGKVEFIKTDPRVNELKHIAKIVLGDEELSSVKFFFDGKECIVTSFPTGQFYRISIELGKKCSVIKNHHVLGKQVIDTEIIDGKTCSHIAVLLKNQEITEKVGNNIVLYDANFNIVFELKDSQFYYTSIMKWIWFDVLNVIHIAFTVILSRKIHLMIINTTEEKLLEIKTIVLDHKLRSVNASTGKNHCVTFSYDGTYNLYEFDDDGQWKKIVMVNCSHWQTGGLIGAQVDVNAQNILTLSKQGNFTCTSFNATCNHKKQLYQIDTPIIIDETNTEGIGFEDELGTPKRMTWTMINKKNELYMSEIAHSKQKNEIVQEFSEIKSELLTLLEMNARGSDNAKISIEEFDLNVDYRIEFRENCKIERQKYEAKILGDIQQFKIETEDILKNHWDSLFIKPKSIYCLKKIYKVDNYPISIIDQEIITKANKIIEKRATMKNGEEHASTCSFLSKHYFDKTVDEKILAEKEYGLLNNKSLMGSISFRFIDMIEQLNNQYNYYKLEMAEDEIILLQFMVNKLKHSFNRLFDDMFNEKQRQLDNLNKFNDRLRFIETEFRLACKIEPTEPSPVNYEWNQYEQTEQLIHVKDNEVSVKPYPILTSNQNMFNGENSSKEDIEHNAQLLASDSFRRRALLSMMDGVLEKKWEDELKNEVPKPQCLLNTKPENYTKEHFKAIKAYEELTTAKNNERMKYKHMLDEEKTKIIQQINEILEEFDNKVLMIFKIKLKYNSAISQEYLKIFRLSKMLSDSGQRKQQVKQHEETIVDIENKIAELIKKIAKTEATHSSLLNTIETLKHKNNVLNKRFKSEFPSKLIYEQALIAYNRRPKIQGSLNYSSLLGYQFLNTIMDPSDDKLDLLCSEFVKYLDTLRVYDDYKYVDDYKLNMDKETWHKVCNFRRIKIESEFKISTFQKDAVDKANLLDTLIHDKEFKEGIIEKSKSSIILLKNQELHYKDDPEIQLVVKQGNAEIELTGHFKDFNNTTLIPKNVIEKVNSEIKEMGKIKIDMLSNLLSFKRKCRLLEWNHAILKNHKITLYKYRYDVITSMKITENMLHYLKFEAKGINIAEEAEQKVEKELAAIQITYSKEKKELMRILDELIKKINSVKNENENTDKNIDQMNLYLSELQNKIDNSLTNKLKVATDTRMKNIMERAQIITNIQKLHKDIYSLQTELELLLLKTFPTLYTTPKGSSIRK